METNTIDEDTPPGKPIPMEREIRKLTTKQIIELLDKESPNEWEPGQVFNLPVNTTR